MVLPTNFSIDAALKAELTEDEGLRRYPYTDSTKHISIGVGRNLTNTGLSLSEIDQLLTDDILTAAGLLDTNVPWWRDLSPGKQRVMINLCFNMGWVGLSGFVDFLAAMQAGDWFEAVVQLKCSRWWTQVGSRGPRMAARLLAPDPGGLS